MSHEESIRFPLPVTPELRNQVKFGFGVDAEVQEAAEEITAEGHLNLLVKLRPTAERISVEIESVPLKAEKVCH